MLFNVNMISIVSEMMAKGHSPTEVAAALGISKKTLARHIKSNEALREAYEIGLTKFEAKLEVIGRDLMTGHLQGKEGVWKMFMQKFSDGWADKAEVKDTTGDVSSYSDTELQEAIERLNKQNK